MASLHNDRPDSGYATPIAMVMCMAVTVTTGVLAAGSVSGLELARRDLERQQAALLLDGEVVRAARRVFETREVPRLQWSVDTELGPVEVLAEAEFSKAKHNAAADADGVEVTPPPPGEAAWIPALLLDVRPAAAASESDAHRIWTLCGPSLFSPYGAADRPSIAPAVNPASAPTVGSSRLGQLWRVRVSGAGWVDERIVRFTGHQNRAAATVERRFFRGEKVGNRCDNIFKAAAAR